MPAVLDATGLTIETLAEIKVGMEQDFRDRFGAGALLGPDTPEGKIIGVVAERYALLQQLAQALLDAMDPASASGVALERIAAYTAVTKNPATRSTINLYLAGTPSTSIPLNTLVSVEDAGDQFQTTIAALLGTIGNMTVVSGTAAIAITSITRSGTVASVTTTAPHGLVAGAVMTVSGATGGDAALYNVTAEIENIGGSTFDYNMTGTPGGSAAGTPVYQDEGLAADHITFADIAVRSVAHGLATNDWVFVSGADTTQYNALAQVVVLDVDHFTYQLTPDVTVTPATGSYTADEATEVAGESVSTGAVQGLASTITTIVNAISGWDRVENALDATLGKALETDTAFRARRLAALQGLGNSTLEAIRADLLLVTLVTAVFVFENDTDNLVGSRPPHSVEAVVEGGAGQAIVDALFDSKGAGIATYGTEAPIDHTDSQGTVHAVLFSRPTVRDIWLEIDFTIDSDTWPSDGLAQAQTALLAYGNALGIGDDVVIFPTLVATLSEIPGILDLVIRIADVPDGDPDPSPTLDNNIVIAETAVSAWDSSRLILATV